jgi:hypothetical protein
MCNPLTHVCTAAHYPFLIDSAMELVQKDKGEVHLSKGAQDVLYKHGSDNKAKFEHALKNTDKANLEKLSEGLRKRLEAALANSKQIDANGEPYNPQRIDEDAMKKALATDPWVP